MTQHVLIDGDGVLYRCGFAVEKTRYLVIAPDGTITKHSAMKEVKDLFGPDANIEIWSRKEYEPVENALKLVSTVLTKIFDKYPNSNKQIWLSPSVGNFRDQIAKTHKYKGNRDAQQRPRYYMAITEYLLDHWGAKYAKGQEADDELGIGGSSLPNSVMVSHDKDLLQVPGAHYDWTKEVEQNVSKKEGTINFYSQVLSGDTTDNIYGIRGIGPATARKMLSDCTSSRDCWEVILDAYKANESEDRAIENSRLLWIRRKVGEIWEPPV